MGEGQAPEARGEQAGARLAICVVYVVAPGTEWLLRLQLRKIAETTTVPYRIFAAVPRATERARKILARWSERVEIVPMEASDLRGSAEHAHYLDQLVAEAAAHDVTHVATLDMDSFPVAIGWAERLTAQLTPDRPFAAVLRRENGDRNLPHPSGFLCDIAYYRGHRPR